MTEDVVMRRRYKENITMEFRDDGIRFYVKLSVDGSELEIQFAGIDKVGYSKGMIIVDGLVNGWTREVKQTVIEFKRTAFEDEYKYVLRHLELDVGVFCHDPERMKDLKIATYLTLDKWRRLR